MTNKRPLCKCDECPLQDRPFVPSVGPQGASIAIVGESPGFQESIIGEPFVGPSGRLLEEILKRYGIVREDVFLTNTVLCHPDRNVDPPKEAIEACRARLDNEIKDSRTIVALGNFAAKTLLSTNVGILKLRVGPPKKTERYPKANVIPTIHPAAALRSSDYFPYIVSDLAKISQEPKVWSAPSYQVPKDDQEALKAIEFLSQYEILSVDIETATEKDLAYERPERYQLLCVGIGYSDKEAIVFTGEILQNEYVREQFAALLKKSKLVAQNGKFDLPALQAQFGPCKLWFDTMLASYALDERGGIHGLKVMGREWLGAPDYAEVIKQYTGRGRDFGAIPSDILYKYNATDCSLTYALYLLFADELHKQNRRRLHDFLVRAANALINVEHEGIGVDNDYLDELDETYTARLQTLEEQLQKWVQNPRSYIQVKAALASLGVETASTDVSHLQGIFEGVQPYKGIREADEVSSFITQLLEYRKDQKLHGTYISGTRKRLWGGRIYPTYLLHGTTSGRLSCRNPNVQNIPRGSEIRKLFIPNPEYSFVQADFKQGELRVLAVLSKDQYLTDVFNAGRDLLDEIATGLFGISNAKKMRVKTKNIVYGSSYGMILGRGKQGVQYAKVMEMSNDEAFHYQQRFFELIPGIVKWQEETRNRVLAGETLTTYTGRRRRFWVITDENKKDILNECLAFVPQSTLSDICLSGLIELVDRGFHPRITVHDSIVIECPTSDVEYVQEVMNESLPRAAREFSTAVPFEVEFKVGRNWGDIS